VRLVPVAIAMLRSGFARPTVAYIGWFGPRGLASIVSTALEACRPGGVSFTLEVHQAEGRLPLGDAAPLFPPGSDTAAAEQVNYWLSVLSGNVTLLSQAIAARAPAP